ncbi:hypothetical protein M422DRAFT_73264 [Sphaerobolus stellatus SS14]|nr:hypothetical protein M422DRAFT_73264 [Sphaerobolus stellatus SS14]
MLIEKNTISEKNVSDVKVNEEAIGETSSRRSSTSEKRGLDTSRVDRKALLRKMDIRFIPWMSFLYFLSFLDRSSIGNARLYGLEQDLNMTDNQYLMTLSIFFISYAAFEVPSNVFLKRLRPSIWLPACMTIWGICMTCQGLVHNYSGLLAVRWWLGLFEAGYFPGVAYFFSCWYKRSEFGFRTAVFTSMTTAAGAFGGLLAAAISNMDGVGDKAGWSWIFILEGLVTVVAGIMSFWIIVDFPDTAKFITEEERKCIIEGLEQDGQFSARGETFKIKHVWKSLRDWKTWICIRQIFIDGPLYAFSLFTPSIISQLATPANLLSVPIYVFACLVTCVVGYYADKLGNRGFLNLGCLALGMTGYIILIVSRNATLSYIAIYLASTGIYPVVANSTTWYANNVEGSLKRGVTVAMAIGFGNLQGIVSSNVYRAKSAPWYTLGHAIQLGYIGLSFICTSILMLLLRAENKRRDRGERDEIIWSGEKGQEMDEETVRRGKLNGIFQSVEEARREKGDYWSGFRYHL